MSMHVSNGDDRPTQPEVEAETADPGAVKLSVACGPHETPTLVPPSEDEPPPTVRWTPPPVLIARSRFERNADKLRRRVISPPTAPWTRR